MSFCYYCMKERTELPNGACPVCNRNIEQMSKKQRIEALAPGSVLMQTSVHEIIVGTVLNFGDTGITYTALEKRNGYEHRVALKEYFPRWIAVRDIDGEHVEIFEEDRSLFENSLHAFEFEGKMLFRLKNANISECYDVLFNANSTSYFVLEFVEGISLREYIRMKGSTFKFSDAVQMMHPVFDALSYCHENGVLHRNVGPDSILITSDVKEVSQHVEDSLPNVDEEKMRIKLVGFEGKYARYNDQNNSLIQNYYKPIELISDKQQDGPYTDVYGLSAAIYFLITGRRPVYCSGSVAIAPPEAFGAAITPNQSIALMKGLEFRPKDRIQTISELWQVLNLTSHESPPMPTSQLSLKQINGNFFQRSKWHVHNRSIAGSDSKEADIYLRDSDDKISQKHCLFVWNGKEWMVTAMSRLGLSVNKERITGQESRPLTNGDTISIGSYDLKVMIR